MKSDGSTSRIQCHWLDALSLDRVAITMSGSGVHDMDTGASHDVCRSIVEVVSVVDVESKDKVDAL